MARMEATPICSHSGLVMMSHGQVMILKSLRMANSSVRTEQTMVRVMSGFGFIWEYTRWRGWMDGGCG